MAELKITGNCKKLVVAGCLAERYRAEIQKEIPMSRKNRFEKLVVKALKNAYLVDIENAVAVLGVTGAAKSTFIAYMLSCKLKYMRVPEQPLKDVVVIDQCPGLTNIPVIGHKVASETLFPAGYVGNANDRVPYIDPTSRTIPSNPLNLKEMAFKFRHYTSVQIYAAPNSKCLFLFIVFLKKHAA
jgi:hypothetical protein